MSIIQCLAEGRRWGTIAPTFGVWSILANAWGVNSNYTIQELAPEGVCATCWGFNVCAECLGEYPNHCPAGCKDGTCGCN